MLVHVASFPELDRLDRFEGSEYERITVQVEIHSESQPNQMEVVEADVYKWIAGEQYLDHDKEWSYEEFVQKRIKDVKVEERM
jgi:hypothetical protein